MFRFSLRAHRQEFLIAALAVLALIIAQLGAIAHAYTHQPTAAKAATYRQTTNSQEYCGECLDFAPLLAGAGTPATPALSLQVTQSPSPPDPPASFLDHRTYLAFRSRAPPVSR
jgi:hypothetical protein